MEIFSAGDESLDLARYHLTDDVDALTKWTFPSIILDPGEYFVVFASSQPTDSFVDAQGNLHTNFSLQRDGEFIGLTSGIDRFNRLASSSGMPR